jgi:branched-chain amino acid transport system substrate-binding protein
MILPLPLSHPIKKNPGDPSILDIQIQTNTVMSRNIIAHNMRSIICLSIFILLSINLNAQEPYSMLDTPQPFTGPETQSADAKELKAIKIGLFSPYQEISGVARSIIQGVSLAIEQANAQGGYQSVPFVVVQRWANDPWGAGSKEMIKLVYQDRVWAVIGSINGDATHIAQQVVTKAWVPLVSPIASDSSLTHINLPWIFRLPPDDRVQADLLISHIVQRNALQRIGLISSTEHDGRYSSDELQKALHKKQLPPVFHFTIDADLQSFDEIIDRINSFKPDAMVIRLQAYQLADLIHSFSKQHLDFPLFIPWIPGFQADLISRHYSGALYVVEPFKTVSQCSPYLRFEHSYSRRFAERPTFSATYAYDAAQLIIKSIQSNGLKRTALAKSLTELSGHKAASGPIKWDNGGGNLTQPVIKIFP